MNDELQHLKNLGKTSAQWLHAVGIHSASDLRRLGAVDAYRAVRKRGFRASKVLLYAIEGALLDMHWNDIPTERKEALNLQLNASASPAKKKLRLMRNAGGLRNENRYDYHNWSRDWLDKLTDLGSDFQIISSSG